ncbi:MAG: cytochrome-c peroxidase [Gemmatimonadota bacterium]
MEFPKVLQGPGGARPRQEAGPPALLQEVLIMNRQEVPMMNPSTCSRRFFSVLGTLVIVVAACSDAEDVDPTGLGLDPAMELEALPDGDLDRALVAMLAAHGYTGSVESTVEQRLGRPVDSRLARLGEFLFFDPVTSLTGDNTCAGCHAPNASFGGTQPIAIGVDNNGIVGPDRTGPRNLRRSPTVINSALFPRIMLNSRFESLSGDPFDNSADFLFPDPDGTSLSYLPHLLAAQAFQPVVDRSEMAGFVFQGSRDEMRQELARRVDAIERYRAEFGKVYPEIADGAPIVFDHIGEAMAEFQISLVFADAPLDQYARGRRSALTPAQKRGALLFFGDAGCVSCHAVDVPFASGDEMFTDYREHVVGVPQIVPDASNVSRDGPGEDEDFGLEQITGDPDDRYAFRTSPLRNVALQPYFMHSGAFTDLEEAIRHHLNAYESARNYSPDRIDPDLRNLGPVEPVLERLDERIAEPPKLTEEEIGDLVDFVCKGLLDRDAMPNRMQSELPRALPSGLPVHEFQFGAEPPDPCLEE